MKIKAVIWDMGGVILRTGTKVPREQLAQLHSITLDELYDLVFNSDTAENATLGLIEEKDHWQAVAISLNIPHESVDEFRAKFWEGDLIDTRLIEYIQSLRKRVKTGLLSNAWSDARNYLCQRIDCEQVFDYTIFSCEIGLKKPDAEIYHDILQKMQVEPQEAIFVDDFAENIDGANAVGIYGIQFNSTEQVIADITTLLDVS